MTTETLKDVQSWLDKLQYADLQLEDPVYEGVVRDFQNFDQILDTVYNGVDLYMNGINQLCKGMTTLSESVVTGLTKKTDDLIAKDAIRFRGATQKVTRADAPHSAVAKLKRDLDFNVVNPLRRHLAHNKQLRQDLEQRRQRMAELQVAQRRFDQVCATRNIRRHDKQYITAEAALEAARVSFREVDKPVFEWLMMLEAYKGDIYDSLLQTIKYLQYEFFSLSLCTHRNVVGSLT
eukprot:GHVS01039965.1.p1 GENE.GHVS01039965.1~~GHVS01039965.1.p1  ORF type:complete len:235 (+),score=33.50 GHVS01039965.1:286-990(+)